MSYLSRILKRQQRVIDMLKIEPIECFTGFGLSQILVFDGTVYHFPPGSDEPLTVQEAIDSGVYKDIKNFDGYQTADVEFSAYYWGKRNKDKYDKKTKRQLVELGIAWRTRVTNEFPKAKVSIVVHYDEMDGWFLDTFNWDIQKEWNPKNAVWL